MNEEQVEAAKKAYKESRNRVVFSQIGSEISKNKTGDIVRLRLVLNKNDPNLHYSNKLLFKDENGLNFMLFNDSPKVMNRLLENYDIPKGGTIIGDFEFFQNGVRMDLLVPAHKV